MWIRSIFTRIRHIAMIVAGTSLLVMVLVGIADILLPKLLHIPVPGAFELSESLMVACVFLPLAWTQAHRGHVKMGFLETVLPSRVRVFFPVFTTLFSLGFYGILAFEGWILALRSVSIREYAAGVISFPLYPAKIALSIGLSLMVCQLIAEIIQPFTRNQTIR